MGDFKLKQLSSHTYYFAARSNIGVYEENGDVILIDSGSDKEAGRQVMKFVKQQKWKIKLIINTHSNADHIGGNAFIQKRTECRIAATGLETPFINHPFFEPSFLNGGYPHKRLQNKFLLAAPSKVTDIIPDSGPVLDTPLEALSLPGHFLQMIGVQTPDSILFTADALIPEEIVNKYHIFYLYDICRHLETLSMLKEREAVQFVPSHGDPIRNITEMADANIAKILEIIGQISNICTKPVTAEELLEHLCIHYGLELNGNQYVLLLSTIRAYLAYMLDEKMVEILYNRGRMEWKTR